MHSARRHLISKTLDKTIWIQKSKSVKNIT